MSLLEVMKNCVYLLISTALIYIIVYLWMDLLMKFKIYKMRNEFAKVQFHRIDSIDELKQVLSQLQDEENNDESNTSD
jgi:CHASE3 domain sensor protein